MTLAFVLVNVASRVRPERTHPSRLRKRAVVKYPEAASAQQRPDTAHMVACCTACRFDRQVYVNEINFVQARCRPFCDIHSCGLTAPNQSLACELENW